jgi:hypothetical protein
MRQSESLVRSEVFQLQKHDRGHTDEEASQRECEALGINPATQRPASDQP